MTAVGVEVADRATEETSQAAVPERTQHRTVVLRVGQPEHEVQQRRAPALECFDTAEQRGGVDVLGSHLLARGEDHRLDPRQQVHLVAQTLDEVLEQVVVRVDQAGNGHLATSIESLGGGQLVGVARGADPGDPAVADADRTALDDVVLVAVEIPELTRSTEDCRGIREEKVQRLGRGLVRRRLRLVGTMLCLSHVDLFHGTYEGSTVRLLAVTRR